MSRPRRRTRRVARLVLAAGFVGSGLDIFLHPMNPAHRLRGFTMRLAVPGGRRLDPELVVRATGVIQAGAGGLLALGRAPRLTALALGVTATTNAYLRRPAPAQPPVGHQAD